MKVNEKRRGRPPKKHTALSKEVIINAAKKLMEAKKTVPSIRTLAAELQVDAMAIYYYFKNKNELLEAITTSLISEIYQPKQSKDWQRELLKLCKSYLKALDKYDGLLNTLLTMKSNSPAEVFTTKFKQIIQLLELDDKIEYTFLCLLVDYIHGFSLAKSCDDSCTLKIDDIDEPMALIFKGVTAK